jgi:hypothetical protein
MIGERVVSFQAAKQAYAFARISEISGQKRVTLFWRSSIGDGLVKSVCFSIERHVISIDIVVPWGRHNSGPFAVEKLPDPLYPRARVLVLLLSASERDVTRYDDAV